VTATLRSNTALVDVTYPGNTTAGLYPYTPVLRDNAFQLHVDCHHALFANVAGNGSLRSSSPGVTTTGHVSGSGQYVLQFGEDISSCAPVATVHNGTRRTALAAQAYLALGSDGRSLRVSVNKATTQAVDWGFDVVVTCGEEPSAVFPESNGFYNALSVPEAGLCGLTGSWYDPTPGSVPSDQGYVSTWASSPTTAGIQTKNGGYGIASGSGVDLVATC
jgi:hypothetical protein